MTLTYKDRILIKGKHSLYKMPASMTSSDMLNNLDIVINPENYGTVIDTGNNLVVDVGREVTAKVMSGEWPPDVITTFCVGVGGYTTPPACPTTPPNPPLGTDTDLYDLSFCKDIQSIEHPNIAADTFVTFIEATEWNGYEFSEWGLKLASGKLYSRRTTRPYPKDGSFAILSKWTVQY